jgi:hypothetical protein
VVDGPAEEVAASARFAVLVVKPDFSGIKRYPEFIALVITGFGRFARRQDIAGQFTRIEFELEQLV